MAPVLGSISSSVMGAAWLSLYVPPPPAAVDPTTLMMMSPGVKLDNVLPDINSLPWCLGGF
jgi:hypothetical protein